MARIRISDPNYNDTIMGVQFYNGVGDMSWGQIEKLKSIGRWTIEVIKEECEGCKRLETELALLRLEVDKLKKRGK